VDDPVEVLEVAVEVEVGVIDSDALEAVVVVMVVV